MCHIVGRLDLTGPARYGTAEIRRSTRLELTQIKMKNSLKVHLKFT